MNFASPSDWDCHYSASPEPYEWLTTWAEIRAPLLDLCSSDAAVLELGCGNSTLGASLWDSGVHDVTCVDISPAVIDTLKARDGVARPAMRFLVMDAMVMSFADQSFDVVIEKSTSDALACAPGGDAAVSALAAEAFRVLRRGGVLAVVSFGNPRVRLPALRRAADWGSVEARRLVKPALRDLLPDDNEAKYHHLYLLTK